MIVTKVETIRLDEFPNLLWLRLHTDAGPVGLGGILLPLDTPLTPPGVSNTLQL